ncbi:hypothetical protein LY78DRAFT_16674 [Colletotrichum sublineola]|nr:hypothetical protein LY78DRAFT_16674 [Colletotrichum sublineola]
MPLSVTDMATWSPIQFDALGIVTIFGTREMNLCIGNLVASDLTEWLPVLGSFAVANNEIISPEPGFILYNITDGIMAIDVSSWFTRWLTSYPITYSATTITLRMDGKAMPVARRALSLILACILFSLLLTLSILLSDAWGVVNMVALVLSVLVRQSMVQQLRFSIDATVNGLRNDPGSTVKVFTTLPGGKAVTIRGPRELVVQCLLTDPRPGRPRLYYLSRVACWASFGAHALTLGMSCLLYQIVSVCILLASTYMVATHLGDRNSVVGTKLRLELDMGEPSWTRSPAYRRLNLSRDEEETMIRWGLMPQRSNQTWWCRFRKGR